MEVGLEPEKALPMVLVVAELEIKVVMEGV